MPARLFEFVEQPIMVLRSSPHELWIDRVAGLMPKRPRIGDVFEIPTKVGLTYAQYTHNHQANYGELVRVFDKTFRKRPVDFEKLAEHPVRFSVFFPLGVAIHRRVFEIVAHLDVRADLQPFPTFRHGFNVKPTDKVKIWFLWDGKKEWKVGELTSEQRRLPILEIWNDTALIEAIEQGWRPETDPQ